MSDIETRLTALIHHEFGLAPGRLTPRSPLHEFGDSLDWFSLLGAIEAEFGIEIDDTQERTLVTVADLLRLVLAAQHGEVAQAAQGPATASV
jgi:acyl carrier protein